MVVVAFVVEGSVAVLGEVEGPVEVEGPDVVTSGQKGNTLVAKNGFPCGKKWELVTGATVVDAVVVTGALVVVVSGATVVDAVEGVALVVVTGALVVVPGATVVVLSDAGWISIGSRMQIASFLSFLFNFRLIFPYNFSVGYKANTLMSIL